MGKKKSKRLLNQTRRHSSETVQRLCSMNPVQTNIPETIADETANKSCSSHTLSVLSMDFDEFDKEVFSRPKHLGIDTVKSENTGNATTIHDSTLTAADNNSGAIHLEKNSSSYENKKSDSRNFASYQDLVDGGAYQDFPPKRPRNVSKMDFESAGDRVLAGSRSFSHRSLFSNENRPLYQTTSVTSVHELPQNEPDPVTKSSFNVYGYSDTARNNYKRATIRSMSNSINTLSIKENFGDEVVPSDFVSEHSEFNKNQSSKISTLSINDEFVLIAGHPPCLSTSAGDSYDKKYSHTRDEEAQSRVQASIIADQQISNIEEKNVCNSSELIDEESLLRSSSKHSMETTSNTDDRLLLAAKYSLSPEAEGLLDIAHRQSSDRSSSNASFENTDFVGIPVTCCHTGFEDTYINQWPCEGSIAQVSIDVDPPQKALVVTSALTPVVPKRRSLCLSNSSDSIVLQTPQTVQKMKRSCRSMHSNSWLNTTDVAVQTGNTIRLRQNQCADVLSELAYLPTVDKTRTTDPINCLGLPQRNKFFRFDMMDKMKHQSNLAPYSKPNSTSRFRLCSEFNNNLVATDCVAEPSSRADTASKWNFQKNTSEREEPKLSTSEMKTTNGDTIKMHVPKGRIRDLAEAFNRLDTNCTSNVQRTFDEFCEGDALSEKRQSSRSDDNRKIERHNFSSTNVSKTSTQTLFSHEDKRGSKCSSSQNLPHIFTRNTFLVREVGSNKSTNAVGSLKNLSAQKKIVLEPSSQSTVENCHAPLKHASSLHSYVSTGASSSASETPKMYFSAYSQPVDIHIHKFKPIRTAVDDQKKLFSSVARVKTLETPSIVGFDEQYGMRPGTRPSNQISASDVFSFSKKLVLPRPMVGKKPTMNREKWPSFYQPLNSHTCPMTSPNGQFSQKNWKSDDRLSNNVEAYENFDEPTYNVSNTKFEKQRDTETGKTSLSNNKCLYSRNPYSPPATEDAGSRITHHTSTTIQEDLLTTEDSIRGKIDRMFDFVESDDSRKTVKNFNNSPSSTVTFQTNSISIVDQPKRLELNSSDCYRNARSAGSWNEILVDNQKNETNYDALTSPDKRYVVRGSPFHHVDLEPDYSLSEYREIQRAQLRRRLPSADEPQFLISPTCLSVSCAGHNETHQLPISAKPREKAKYSSSVKERRVLPIALATSTPMDSPQSRNSSSLQRTLELNNNNVPIETFVSTITANSTAGSRTDVLKKIDRLVYMLENTQKQMEMNGAALADALKKGKRVQEIAANRSILITRETLRQQRNELRRLHTISAFTINGEKVTPLMAKDLRGSVVFHGIIVHLNKLFISRLAAKDDNSYSFMALFKYDHQVEATELVPLRVNPEGASDKVYFEKHVVFSDVPADFTILMEIYAMKLSPAKPIDASIGAAFASKCKSLIGPPQKKCHVPNTETAFKFRGRLVLDRYASGEHSFYLDDVTYPLEGTVNIKTKCSKVPEAFDVDFRAFLTMFHTISDMASWERYWVAIRRETMFFWKYPEDEQLGRQPKMQFDLTRCTDEVVEECSFELCPKPNTFAMELLVDGNESHERTAEKKKVLLSTDSNETMTQWLFVINQTLDVVRGSI